MEKYRLSTTISKKHRDLLKKHLEKYKTQQKVLELALESLENNSNQQHSPAISLEEELQLRIIREMKYTCIFPREFLKILFKFSDVERLYEFIADQQWLEFSVEFQYNKSVKECSLKEIMDGVTNSARMANVSVQRPAGVNLIFL